MASSRRARSVAIGVAALLLLAAALAVTGGPAGAGAGVARPVPSPIHTVIPPPAWTPAPCATGAITGHQVSLADPRFPALHIQGWIQPCDPAVTSDGFTVARYFASRGLRSRSLVPYGSMSAPTTFDLRIDGAGGDMFNGPLTAVCVIHDVNGRSACLGLGPVDGALVATPIPTDDPRVLVPTSREAVYEMNPTCGTCV